MNGRKLNRCVFFLFEISRFIVCRESPCLSLSLGRTTKGVRIVILKFESPIRISIEIRAPSATGY
jgi:hypothetical protein